MTDIDVLKRVVAEYMRAQGGSLVTSTACDLVTYLIRAYRGGVTADGACDALEQLSTTALAMRDAIRKEVAN